MYLHPSVSYYAWRQKKQRIAMLIIFLLGTTAGVALSVVTSLIVWGVR